MSCDFSGSMILVSCIELVAKGTVVPAEEPFRLARLARLRSKQ